MVLLFSILPNMHIRAKIYFQNPVVFQLLTSLEQAYLQLWILEVKF